MYTNRSGLIYQQLGNVYRNAYRNGRLDRKKTTKLCDIYYKRGCDIFERNDSVAELIAVHVDRMMYSNLLVESKRFFFFFQISNET